MSIASIVTVFGASIVLEPADGVFIPTPNGMFYSRSIRIGRGERIIDIGTGSGVLAVAAAKAGGQVVATDIDSRAVAAAERNAALNNVSIDVAVGALFGPFTGPFEVILANLPNEIVAPAHLARLAPDEARTFSGGEHGNEHLVSLLAVADRYMHARSRLYLGVHSLTDYHGTLRAALARYAVRLIDFSALPAKSFVVENLDFYRDLAAAGVIQIFQAPDGQWQTYGYVYELTWPESLSRVA
jgi:methylase of polypeptide subunit release factors